MDSQRIDLGPNRWLAAGGQAFVHVSVTRGKCLGILLVPVREVRIEQAGFVENLRQQSSGLLYATAGAGPFILGILAGHIDSPAAWFGLTILAAAFLGIVIRAHRNRDRYALWYGYHSERMLFTDLETQRSEFVQFMVRLEQTSKAASNKPREYRKYLLYNWQALAVIGAVFTGLLTAVVPWVWERGNPWHVFAASTVAILVIFGFASHHLIFHSALRRAHAQLLDNEPDAAIATLRQFLQRKPDHPYATRLMTIAELLRGNMDVANEIIVRDDLYVPSEPWWSQRTVYFKLREFRQNDH